MKTLEDILAEYFGCKKPFLKTPKNCGDFTEYFTAQGGKAYGKLTQLLYDVGALTEHSHVINDIVETLDNIVNEI